MAQIPLYPSNAITQKMAETMRALAETGRVCTPLRARQRDMLIDVLREYGVSVALSDVSERDLITMYEAACIDPFKGSQVAKRIEQKYSPSPLLDPSYQYPQIPVKPPVYEPPAPEPKSDYATNKRVDDVKSGLVSRIEQIKAYTDMECKETRKSLTETLLAVTEALPEAVKGHVADALKALTPVTLTVVIPNNEPVALGIAHRKTADIIKMLAAGVNVYLHGPAGSGKTTAGRKCAEAFGLPFYFAAKVESEYMLLGFKDARGEAVRTQFREAYEHGGVFLFDELDGSSPGAVVALNAALANGICPFPDGIIMRHENFKCIAAGNTKLTGASRQYVGRTQLDAASVDRFAFVAFDYDDALETALATNAAWCEYVQAARKAVADRGLPHLITPRATYDGCKLLEAGLDRDAVEAAVLWKGLDFDTIDQIIRAMPQAVVSKAVTQSVSIL